jgi:hypothetical protein
MNVRLLLTGALVAGLGSLSACGESAAPVAPRRMAPAGAAASSASTDVAYSGGHRRVRVLRWDQGRDQDLVASATIDASGGTIRIPGANATFTVPAGALSAPTTITVRALAGRRVVFTMLPEGLQFATPATLTLGLRNTNAFHKSAWRRLLTGGYIESPVQIGDDDSVDSYETEPATVDLAVTVASFLVPHFSVVILASQMTNPATTDPGGSR